MSDSCFSVKGDCQTPAPDPNKNGKVDGLPWDMSEKGVQAHEDGLKSSGRSIFWDAVGLIPGAGMVSAGVDTVEGLGSAMSGNNAAAASHFGDAAVDAGMALTGPIGGAASLLYDLNADNKRKEGAMPDQAPTATEKIQNTAWDWISK